MNNSIFDAKYLDELPDGTIFNVHNGDWRGLIVKKDDKTYVKILGENAMDKTDIVEPKKYTIEFAGVGCKNGTDIDYCISIMNSGYRAWKEYVSEFGYKNLDHQVSKEVEPGIVVLIRPLDLSEYNNHINLMIWISEFECYISSGNYHFSRLHEAEEKVLKAYKAITKH